MKLANIWASISGIELVKEESDDYKVAMVQALEDAGKSVQYIQDKVSEYQIKERKYKAMSA